jgi:hypothetical protein
MEKIFSRILHPKFSIELTVDQFLIKYIVVRTEGIEERGHLWKTKFSLWMTKR